MQTTYRFIRHGESTLNATPEIIAGRSDHVPLTPTGINQSKRLGRYLLTHGLHPDRLLSSPAVRARQTAYYAMQAYGYTGEAATVIEALHEMEQGDNVGKLRATILTPAVLEQREQLGLDFRLPGANTESLREVGTRMFAWLEAENAITEPGTTTFIFGHGMAIAGLTARLCDWGHNEALAAFGQNTSMTTIRYDQGWQVDEIAQVPHLD